MGRTRVSLSSNFCRSRGAELRENSVAWVARYMRFKGAFSIDVKTLLLLLSELIWIKSEDDTFRGVFLQYSKSIWDVAMSERITSKVWCRKRTRNYYGRRSKHYHRCYGPQTKTNHNCSLIGSVRCLGREMKIININNFEKKKRNRLIFSRLWAAMGLKN